MLIDAGQGFKLTTGTIKSQLVKFKMLLMTTASNFRLNYTHPRPSIAFVILSIARINDALL